jgi:hypothetical protein
LYVLGNVLDHLHILFLLKNFFEVECFHIWSSLG